jgi:drug/metabolite transporter (DMT)-like permease
MPPISRSSRWLAIGESLLVTVIWASSFVFVKIGLDHLGPLTIAGLRYFLAFLVLLPFMVWNKNRTAQTPTPHPGGGEKPSELDVNSALSRRLWEQLFLIGLCAYTIGNGTLFWGLKYVPATTGSFLMNLVPLLVLLPSIVWLKEIPSRRQVLGVVVCLAGGYFFFLPGLQAGEPRGILIVLLGTIGFALFSILGREIARDQLVDTLPLTGIPLAFGGGILLAIALPLEGLPRFNPTAWGIVLWLAVINTAFAYVLYNRALRVLTALEMNVMLNISPLVTALIAWIILNERLEVIQIAGILVVIAGVALVQHPSTRLAKESAK